MTTTPTGCVLLSPSSSALAALPDAERVRSVEGLRARLTAPPAVRCVVAGPDVGLADLAGLLVHRRRGAPTPRVVLERRYPRDSEVAEALRSGVDAVVAVGDLGALVGAVSTTEDSVDPAELVHRRPTRAAGPVVPARPPAGRGAPAPLEGRRAGRVVTVFSAKGGCGSTVLATNVAAALSDAGRRRVALVDLDLALGDVAVSLRLGPGAGVQDALAAGPALDADALRPLLAPVFPGLGVLAAPASPGGATVTAADVVRLLDLLAGLVDHVVVDTSSALDEVTLAALDRSDAVLLVTTPDAPALRHLARTLATLGRRAGGTGRPVVVLNRADSRVGVDVRTLERTAGARVAARLPSSRDVPASVNRGVPLVRATPEHPVSRAVRDLVARELLPRRAPRVVDLREPRGAGPWAAHGRPAPVMAAGTGTRSADLPHAARRPAPH